MKIHKKLLLRNFEGKTVSTDGVIVGAKIYNKKICDVPLEHIVCSNEPPEATKYMLFRSARREALRIMKLLFRGVK